MNQMRKLVNWYFSEKMLPYWALFLLDSLIVLFSCLLSGLILYPFPGNSLVTNVLHFAGAYALYMIPTILFFRIFRTYTGVIRYSSFVDLKKVASAMLCAGATNYFLYSLSGGFLGDLSLAFFLSVTILSIFLMWGVRILVKLVYDSYFRTDKAVRAFVYGVRDSGVGLAKSMLELKPNRFTLDGFISNDKDFKSAELMGVKVYQVDDDLASVFRRRRTEAVLVSPTRNDEFRLNTELQDCIINAGLKIYMTTQVREWQQKEGNGKPQLKEVNIYDLLPRQQIVVDMESIREKLAGRKVLITGAAGSIGSEIVRQTAAFHPAELMLIDQAETPSHDIRRMLACEHPDIKSRTIVASILDKNRMEKIFREFRPDYVFHAAAYKHVPMMEDNPSASVYNNVLGTKIVADLSVESGVRKFVMISTDKAVNPTNVMGCSKRICEIYVQSLDKAEKDGQVKGDTQFVTTRFGNVLGSDGSVIPTFSQQIREGGPVTVTDPDIVRYFMFIPEACELVLEAGTKGGGGEIFVFDMGSPVRIADIAKRMIRLSGAEHVRIEYTGLREGEKLFEEVLSDKENTLPSFNDKIRIAKVREYDYAAVEKDIENLIRVAGTYDPMAIVAEMKRIVPEYISNNSVYCALDR